MPPSHTYGFILESTPTYVTRAVVHEEGYVTVEVLQPTGTVITLRREGLHEIRRRLAQQDAEDPVLADLARLEAQTGWANEDAAVQRFLGQDAVRVDDLR